MSEDARYNFKSIEFKWQNCWLKNNNFISKKDYNKQKFIVLKCFLIHQEESIWAM